jgi:DNA mismatch repair protein MutS
MAFHSILYERTDESARKETSEAPDFFVDLNLDQIVNAITDGKQEYNLKPFFYTPLQDMDTIQYRHEIMQELEDATLMKHIESFAKKMFFARRYLNMIEMQDFKNHREGWFLEAATNYCAAVTKLEHDLNLINLKSRGFLAFRKYLTDYANSDDFTDLKKDTQKLENDLSAIRYCVTIKELTVCVRKYEGETDYSLEVEETFEKFKQGAVKDHRSKLYPVAGMNQVEAQILDCVARLYPDVFASLDNFCAQHSHFLDETMRNFDREIQFYLAYLEYIARYKRAGLKFCYPQISVSDKEVYDDDGFDLALAYKLYNENSPIICNDFYIKDQERIFVVSGPNQGGKTTFARAFGQLHYLASLGCPVPGEKARLFLFDNIFTHFENEEDIKNLRSKLQDDLVRIYAVLDQATPNSIILLNEIFTSTTLQDAVFLSKKIMQRIIKLDLLCVWVTFIDELASLGEKTVSMVSIVVPENPSQRTFKIVRRPADGLAYAISIAEKYGLTYDQLKERIQS